MSRRAITRTRTWLTFILKPFMMGNGTPTTEGVGSRRAGQKEVREGAGKAFRLSPSRLPLPGSMSSEPGDRDGDGNGCDATGITRRPRVGACFPDGGQ